MCDFMDICCIIVLSLFFFFFKQKTAYEMRISDWSSDVCSSDLDAGPRRGTAAQTADEALFRLPILSDFQRLHRWMHSCALVQCGERGMINIFKLVSDDGHFRSEGAECCDVVIAGAGPFGRDLSGDARFFRCINMAAIAKLSRCHRQHPAKLTAPQYAAGGAGRKRGPWGPAAPSVSGVRSVVRRLGKECVNNVR